MADTILSLHQRAKTLIEDQLHERYLNELEPNKIEESYSAIRYALTAGGGGKRLRPFLVFLAAEAVKLPWERVLDLAIAVELIHTYTLTIDDIQDKDDVRRGVDACHVQYGQNTAILAAERLFFHGLATVYTTMPQHQVRLTKIFDRLHQGQTADLMSDYWGDDRRNRQHLEFIIFGKTSSMFELCLLAGVSEVVSNESHLDSIMKFGRDIGFMFQAKDDLLEILGDPEKTGKSVGKNRDGDKLTFISLYNNPSIAEREYAKIADTAYNSMENISKIIDTRHLEEIVNYMHERDH